jgi:hypothetical protein
MKNDDLEAAESWDFASADKVPAQKSSRAIVSVAFKREDFDRVAEQAEQLGIRTSEFIREAALDRLRGGVIGAWLVLVVGEQREEIFLTSRAPRTGVEQEGPSALRTDTRPLVATG